MRTGVLGTCVCSPRIWFVLINFKSLFANFLTSLNSKYKQVFFESGTCVNGPQTFLKALLKFQLTFKGCL